MTPERWQRIQALFHEATELGADERAAMLARIGAEDEELRRQVENLLRADSHPSLLMDAGPGELAAAVLEADEDDSLEDERIGAYRIVREIGRGGMGAVYLAERADGQFSMQVAIKLVKRGVDTDEILRRFRYEREILARLDHPNIARLLDGGATDDGRPYLVMEHVEGQRLDAYCDERRLSVDRRLRLFMTVCEAVQYAHRNLVIHRDLKPANILVNADGQVKLLDFGIARLLDEDDAIATAPRTRAGVRVMTPEYASPEQIRGDAVTTTTDVYALGILLYELLTGHRPFERSRRSLEVGDPDRALTPSRPSTMVGKRTERRDRNGRPAAIEPDAVSRARGTSVDRLRRRLRGDLDTIVLKALRVHPSERYPSAEALLDDVRRHLEGRPVAARPDSVPYRVWKYANRHRAGVAVAAAFAMLLIGFASVYTIRVTQERNRAQRELEEKEAVTSFLAELFYAASPAASRGDTLDAFDLLERGAARIETEMADRPSVQGHLLHILSHVYGALGDYDRSVDLAERSLAVRQAHFAEDAAMVSEALNQLGNALESRGDYEGAEEQYRQALRLRRRHFGPSSEVVAESALNLGLLLSNAGRYDEAEPLMREALAIDREQHGNAHENVATALNNLAVLHYYKGEYVAAREALEEALEIRREIYGEPHPRVALTMNNLAAILRRTGDLVRAEALFRDVLGMTRTLHGDAHPDVASTLSNLGAVLLEQGRPAQALPLLEEAVATGRRLLGEHPEQADALTNLGSVLYDLGRYDEAESAFNESLAMNVATRGDSHPRTARARYHLGRVAAARDDRAAAEAHFRAALALQEAVLPEQHDETAFTRRELALLLLENATSSSRPNAAEAESLLVLAQRALEATYGPNDGRVIDLRARLHAAGQHR